MEEALVSVIIPVYNVKPYLAACMESVLAQSYQRLEILLIDDGSTDGSGEMCNQYSQIDTRIAVVHQKNAGLSAARNTGLARMHGQYVVFIDSDDVVHADYVKCQVEEIVKHQADIVLCGCQKVSWNYKKPQMDEEQKSMQQCRVLDKEQATSEMLSGKLPMYAHSKLYKAELFQQVIFPEGAWFEDVPVLWALLKKINQVVVVPRDLYYYRQRTDSIVHQEFSAKRMDQVRVAEEIYKEVRKDAKLAVLAGRRCFFCMADNLAMVTGEFPEEQKRLEQGVQRYRRMVLADKSAPISLKVLAVAAYLSPKLVRVLGRAFKAFKKRRFGTKG